MIYESLRRSLWPWARRQPSPAAACAFDAHAEQTRLSALTLRHAARLLDRAMDERCTTTEQAQALCDALVAASAHLRLAWTWFGPADTPEIVPQIVAGPAAAYARNLRIVRNRLTAAGPAFRALQGRRPEPFNINESSLYGPWREAARAHGVRSVLALPLASRADARRGLLLLYADRPDYFALVGVDMFEGLADFVSSVLTHATRQRQLAQLALSDPLTGLYNRAAAHRALDIWPAGRALGLLLLDLDHFKQVNDEQGHAAGDAVLVGTARRLQAALRRNDGVARWGGEEFLVWLPDTPTEQALLVAEKLRAAIAGQPFVLPSGAALWLTLSAGAVTVADGEALDAAVARADRALYGSKAGGRNRVTSG